MKHITQAHIDAKYKPQIQKIVCTDKCWMLYVNGVRDMKITKRMDNEEFL